MVIRGTAAFGTYALLHCSAACLLLNCRHCGDSYAVRTALGGIKAQTRISLFLYASAAGGRATFQSPSAALKFKVK